MAWASRQRNKIGSLCATTLVAATTTMAGWRIGSFRAAALIPSVRLPGGGTMQQLAVGLYNVPRENVRRVIDAALAEGCRTFDFASFYDNEVECGDALRAWLATGHDRSELHITTKVWTTDLGSPQDAVRSAKISIDELGLGPVDVVMVHWPMPGKHVAAYKGLEELVQCGKTKALGISNYSPDDYEELLASATVPPQLNTFENNPMLYRKDWLDFFNGKGIPTMAYKPLQRGGAVLSCGPVVAAAARLGKTPAQVCLRWNLQKGNVVTVKSNSPERIAENVAVFDFELPGEDMAALDALTTDEVMAEALGHWEQRRTGTPAPWGPGLRPERQLLKES